MAYTPARGDTRIAGAVGGTAAESRSVSSVSPAKKLLSSPSTTVQRPRFSQSSLPRSQAGTPIKESSVAVPSRVGRRNPTDDGNPLSKAIDRGIKQLVGAVDFDQLFSDTFASSNKTAATNLVSATESVNLGARSAAVDFGGSFGGAGGGGPSVGSNIAFPSGLREGGFIRRKS